MARQETEEKILEALESLILEEGMKGLGINAVGKRAGVSTELIYRYFNGLPGLLEAWVKQQDFWTRQGELYPLGSDTQTPAELITAMLQGQVATLQKNPALAEIRRWELIEASETGQALAQRRERAARHFIDRLDALAPDADVPAHIAIMLAGVLYLSLRAKTESQFLGIQLREQAGWDRIWAALRQQLTALPDTFQDDLLADLEASRQGHNPTPDRKQT